MVRAAVEIAVGAAKLTVNPLFSRQAVRRHVMSCAD